VILDCNPAALDLHGYSSKEEVVGRSAFEFISERDRARALENFERLFERGSLKDIEYAFLTREGREFPALLSASVMKDSLGEPHGFVAVTKDITPRKGYQKRLEALRLHALELSSAETIGEVADLTFKVMEQVLGFNHASFGVVEDGFLRFIHLWGFKDGGFELRLDGPGITVRAVRTGEAQLVSDIRLDEDYVAGPGGKIYGTLSELDTPIEIGGEVVAVINIESEKLNAFTEMDKKLVEIFAEHVASAMSRQRYVEELKISREELERSNHDLEDYILAASHDLEAPQNSRACLRQMFNGMLEGCQIISPDWRYLSLTDEID
jgi:PAS domain S-box-containing protein